MEGVFGNEFLRVDNDDDGIVELVFIFVKVMFVGPLKHNIGFIKKIRSTIVVIK